MSLIHFIKAVFAVCGEETVLEVEEDDKDAQLLRAPSNALKLSYHIQKLCLLKTMVALDDANKERGEENRKATKRFREKFMATWETDVKKQNLGNKRSSDICDFEDMNDTGMNRLMI